MSESIDWIKTVKPKYKKGKASVKVKGVPSSSKGLTFKQRLAQAKNRLKTQMPLEEKLKYADYIINNEGTREELKSQVLSLYRLLKNLV